MEHLTSTVGAKGQAVIPKPIRQRLGIHPGDELRFSVHADHIHVSKRGDDALLDDLFALPRMRRQRTPARLKADLQDR